jgi:hypothetical protein
MKRALQIQLPAALCAVALLLPLSACRRPAYTVATQTPGSPNFSEYRVLRYGQVLADFAPLDEARFDFTGQYFESASKAMSSLSAEALTPCGWRKLTVEVHPPGKGDIRKAEEAKRNPVYYLNLDEPQEGWKQLSVFVDNRGAGAARIALGSVEQPVQANSYASLTLPTSSVCPEADQLKLNGELIATVSQIESQRQNKDQLGRILIDATGRHCYTYEWASYSRDYSSPFPTSGSEKLPAMRVRLFEGMIDSYFVQLPGMVMSTLPSEYRGNLKDRDCAK